MFASDVEEDADEYDMSILTEDSKLIGSPTKSVPNINLKYDLHDSDSGRPNSFGPISTTVGVDNNELSNSDEQTIYSRPPNFHHHKTKMKTTMYVWVLTFFAAIGGFLFGYDTGVVSGAMLLLKDEFSLSSIWQELIVSVTIGAAAVFSFLSGFLNDSFGRKFVTILASFVFTVGSLILGIAQNKEMLLIGRAILGAGIGKQFVHFLSTIKYEKKFIMCLLCI